MAWAKFDDRWATHPKLLDAGLEAKGLDASGICYAAGQETDGFVPDTALVILAAGHRSPRKVADRLVEVGRWIRDDDRKGYVIHDFDVYNFSRAQGEAKRAKAAERKAEYRARQGRDAQGRMTSGDQDADVHSDTDDETDDDPTGQEGMSPWDNESCPEGTVGGVPPVPTRPDPTRPLKHRSSSSLQVVGEHPAEEEEDLDIVDRALLAIATAKLERCLSDPEHKPINDRAGWLAKVITRDRTAFGKDMSIMAEKGATVDLLVRTFDRQPTAPPSPYPAAGEEHPPVFDEVLVDGEWVAVRVGA